MKSKYNSTKCHASTGELMDSKRECKRYEALLEMQKHHIIRDLKRQVEFELIPRQLVPEPYLTKEGTMRTVERKCSYIADFTYYTADGKYVVEDVKSVVTKRNKDYIIKRKLMLFVHGIQISEIY